MQEHNIANILLYDMAQKHIPIEAEVNRHLISEIVEGWNQNRYVFPKHSIKFQKPRYKKYDLM